MTFTKEQLIEQATKNIAVLRGAVERIPGASDAAVIHLKLAEITLSALTTAPVGEVSEQRDGLILDGTVDLGGTTTHRIIKGASKMKRLPLGTKFYTAPQPLTTSERAELENYRNAQQEVPEEMDLLTCHLDGVTETYAEGWNACRAAMLQGAEIAESPTTMQTAPALDSSPKIAESPSGNSPVIPDCSCGTCRPVTFTDSRFVVCSECGNKRCPHANDHRNHAQEVMSQGRKVARTQRHRSKR
ncbi:hypothetical protein ACSN7C_001834 [Enterobacter hormaechei]